MAGAKVTGAQVDGMREAGVREVVGVKHHDFGAMVVEMMVMVGWWLYRELLRLQLN